MCVLKRDGESERERDRKKERDFSWTLQLPSCVHKGREKDHKSER